jgi:hypothetical protein
LSGYGVGRFAHAYIIMPEYNRVNVEFLHSQPP